jgi:hypothetical protein
VAGSLDDERAPAGGVAGQACGGGRGRVLPSGLLLLDEVDEFFF